MSGVKTTRGERCESNSVFGSICGQTRKCSLSQLNTDKKCTGGRNQRPHTAGAKIYSEHREVYGSIEEMAVVLNITPTAFHIFCRARRRGTYEPNTKLREKIKMRNKSACGTHSSLLNSYLTSGCEKAS